MKFLFIYLFIYLFILKIYLFILRETESVSRGGAEREGEFQAGSMLSAQSLSWGLNSWNWEIMTWVNVMSGMLNWLSHPGAQIQ